jgi:hypothetical protein
MKESGARGLRSRGRALCQSIGKPSDYGGAATRRIARSKGVRPRPCSAGGDIGEVAAVEKPRSGGIGGRAGAGGT